MKKNKNNAMMRSNKRGSYIMEAAIVLPVIMLTVITAILIIMFFYIQMTEQCRLHKVLRAEAGRLIGKTVFLSEKALDITDIDIHVDKRIAGDKVYGKKYLVMEHKGILDRKGVFVSESYCYAADGPAYVRYRSIVKEQEHE